MLRPKLEDLDLRSLRALRVLIALGSVTAAARRLRTSQPTMSRFLGTLRASLGDPILAPSGRTLTPTPFAIALVPRLDRAIAALEALAITDDEDSAIVHRIAVTDYGFNVVVAPFIASPEGMRARFELSPITLEAIGAVGRGEIGLAIAPRVSVRGTEGLVFRPFLHDEHVVVMRAQHPLARETLTKRRYLAARHVVTRTDAPGKSLVERALRGERPRDIAVSVGAMSHALGVVRVSDTLCTMPARFVRALAPELVTRPAPFEIEPIEVCFVFSPRSTTDAVHRRLREGLARYAAQNA